MRLAIGMAMVPRGEVGLIFAELGRTAGLFDQHHSGSSIFIIAMGIECRDPFSL
jgi:Kef-type K+ transport system membrane component KefB